MDLDSDMYKGGSIDFSKMYPKELCSPQGIYDLTNLLYQGKAFDIHNAIGKLPQPKKGCPIYLIRNAKLMTVCDGS